MEKKQEEKQEEVQSVLEQEAGKLSRRERPAGVRFRFSFWNIAASELILVFAVIFFAWQPGLFWEKEATERSVFCGWFAGVYIALALLSAVLCLCEVKLPDKARYTAGWGLVLLAPLGAFFAVDWINGTRILHFSFQKGLANYLCYLVVFALIYAISRRVWITILTGGLVWLFFGLANYFVVQFRGQPILPWDIQSVGTAAAVSGGYVYTPTRPMTLAVLGFLCLFLLGVKLGPKGKQGTTRKFRMVERFSALALSLALFFLLFPLDILSSMGISVWAWNQKTSSEITGIAAGFFANIQFLMVDKPEGYSPERMEELAAQAGALEDPEPLGSPSGRPTIVVVMNESMTDLQKVGDVEFEPDNLPFLHSLEESGEVIWGTAYSSVYGGNTCNSEYEFLTGNTTAFLPSGSKPYQQYVDHEQSGLPAILKSHSYECIAIHPGNRGAWQRDIAYPYLGFQKFVAARDFTVERELIHGLTSDASNYEQVIYEYEHRDKQKGLFLFDVTIQNHGGYEDEKVPTTVRVKQPELEDASLGQAAYPQTEQYLSLTKESDAAFQGLLEYFEQQEDPVVVLFFGDHWPNLETGFLTQLLGADANSLEFEDLMREYQVPFVIWANYPLEAEHMGSVSLNYLSGLLLRAAGLSGTPYTNFLENLRQTLPVITAVGSMDKDGNLYKNGEETPYDQMLDDYASLQYNNAFGKEEKLAEVFTR